MRASQAEQLCHPTPGLKLLSLVLSPPSFLPLGMQTSSGLCRPPMRTCAGSAALTGNEARSLRGGTIFPTNVCNLPT